MHYIDTGRNGNAQQTSIYISNYFHRASINKKFVVPAASEHLTLAIGDLNSESTKSWHALQVKRWKDEKETWDMQHICIKNQELINKLRKLNKTKMEKNVKEPKISMWSIWINMNGSIDICYTSLLCRSPQPVMFWKLCIFCRTSGLQRRHSTCHQWTPVVYPWCFVSPRSEDPPVNWSIDIGKGDLHHLQFEHRVWVSHGRFKAAHWCCHRFHACSSKIEWNRDSSDEMMIYAI